MGPLFSHAKWTCELAIKWTQRQKFTGKSPHFSRSTVHGPRLHFIDTRIDLSIGDLRRLEYRLILYFSI